MFLQLYVFHISCPVAIHLQSNQIFKSVWISWMLKNFWKIDSDGIFYLFLSFQTRIYNFKWQTISKFSVYERNKQNVNAQMQKFVTNNIRKKISCKLHFSHFIFYFEFHSNILSQTIWINFAGKNFDICYKWF